jgi:hypothetical protein
MKKAEDFDPTTDVPGVPLRPTLLVCDINALPSDAARICAPLIALLAPGSRVLITLKFFGTGRDRVHAVEAMRRALGPSVTAEGSPWLFANTLHERLFVGTKIGCTAAPPLVDHSCARAGYADDGLCELPAVSL